MDDFSHLTQLNDCAETLSLAEFDQADYRHHLDGCDLTDQQKSELMLIVWDIMRMWVEMDLPLENCGPILEALIDPAAGESGGVK